MWTVLPRGPVGLSPACPPTGRQRLGPVCGAGGLGSVQCAHAQPGARLCTASHVSTLSLRRSRKSEQEAHGSRVLQRVQQPGPRPARAVPALPGSHRDPRTLLSSCRKPRSALPTAAVRAPDLTAGRSRPGSGPHPGPEDRPPSVWAMWQTPSRQAWWGHGVPSTHWHICRAMERWGGPP